jgi:hypothetical protein
VPDADHTFSRPGNQAFVIPLLLEHLATRRRRERPEVAREVPPATGGDSEPVSPRPTH